MSIAVNQKIGIALFSNPEFGSVRGFMRNGEPWFVALDVATALGYGNPSRSVQDHCKYVELLKTTSGVGLEIPPRGLLVIPESDVYALIFRSNLPKAEGFRRWVCEEVLPSIRKTGSYSVNTPKTFPEALRAYADELERREQAEKELQQYATVLGQMVDLAKSQMETIDNQANELGIGKTYKAVTGIPWLSEYFDLTDTAYQQIGRALTEWCRMLGYEKLTVPHPKYPKGVGNYHVDVIEAFKHKLDNDPMYMAKYRRFAY